MQKRILDIIVSAASLFVLIVPLVAIGLVVRMTSPGPALYWSQRVGRDNSPFQMPKFRSMRVGTPVTATHLLSDPQDFLTPVGKFLRKSSLDELPQLWCILRGDMSIVGPRPGLFSQTDLIKLRTEQGISGLAPGLTGWAQVNGRDEMSIVEKVAFDAYYLANRSLWFDLKIIAITARKVLAKEGVAH